jgi:hypothetical protein
MLAETKSAKLCNRRYTFVIFAAARHERRRHRRSGRKRRSSSDPAVNQGQAAAPQDGRSRQTSSRLRASKVRP